MPISSQRNTDLDKNVYGKSFEETKGLIKLENDVQDNLFNSIKKTEKTATTNPRPFTADIRKNIPTSLFSYFLYNNCKKGSEQFNGYNTGNQYKITDLKDIGPIIELDVHVTKWIDYSTKYGLGYLLSDGTAGVVFNDSTRVNMPSNMS